MSRRWREPAIILAASTIALFSARPFAAGWNDGSRLATIEALVDQHTFAIDHSIFVEVPPDACPYGGADEALRRHGTCDKMWIAGHFYSDKPPLPAIASAGIYWIVQRLTGLKARTDGALFCWLMTFINSGLAYVLAVVAINRMTRLIPLPAPAGIGLTTAFALSSLALVYTRALNSHIMLLGLTAAMLPSMLKLVESAPEQIPRLRLLFLGMLGGLSYATECASGAVIVAALGCWIVYRCWVLGTWRRRIGAAGLFALGVLPAVACHHAITYAIAGTLRPPGTVPEFFSWPGCPFDEYSLTGRWHHGTAESFVDYTLDLLFGKKGFLGSNPMLLVFILGLAPLLRRRFPERPELLWGAALWAGIVVLYAATSTNFSGLCVSVRWFLPLLAPGFLGLAVLLRERPQYRRDVFVVSGWNLLWSLHCWLFGPWSSPWLFVYWIVYFGALGYLFVRTVRRVRGLALPRRLRLGRTMVRVPDAQTSV
jgi:hypothetical protein